MIADFRLAAVSDSGYRNEISKNRISIGTGKSKIGNFFWFVDIYIQEFGILPPETEAATTRLSFVRSFDLLCLLEPGSATPATA